MQHNVLGPVGVRVADLTLSDITVASLRDLRRLLAEHGVVVLPNQQVDDASFTAFLRLFGELTFSQGETPVAGFPDLNVISNVGRTTPPRSVFHVDTSYVSRRPLTRRCVRFRSPPRAGKRCSPTNTAPSKPCPTMSEISWLAGQSDTS